MRYTRTRLTVDERKRQIVTAAVKDARARGVFNISVASVSKLLPDCSKSTVRGYFTQSEIRAAVIADSIEYILTDAPVTGPEFIVGEAVAMKHPLIDKLTEDQKTDCLHAYLSQG